MDPTWWAIEGRFYGVDLNPSHVAAANALAADLGLANVVFALADLRDFAAGRPERGPAAAWLELFDLVLAHGVAAWVDAEVRQALVAAAAPRLRPGGGVPVLLQHLSGLAGPQPPGDALPLRRPFGPAEWPVALT